MAREILDVGTSAGSGDGEPLRTGMIKINNMTEELYAAATGFVTGWGYYKDSETTTPTQTITTTPSKLLIDGLGSTSNSDYLPGEIKDISELWDATNNNINAISVGDSYDCRIDFTVQSKTGSPTYLDLMLDIGGTASPTITIVDRIVGLSKTPPVNISVGFPIFSLGTFITNQGQLFLSTDSGTVTISSRAVFIKRDYRGFL